MPVPRPASIAELASAARTDPDAQTPSKESIKYYLRRAETHKRTGRCLAAGAGKGPTQDNPRGTTDAGLDLERAFIEYARAATLVVDTVPLHRDYSTELNEDQRKNLTENGQDMLNMLARVRQLLVERYERYLKSPDAANPDAVPAFKLYSTPGSTPTAQRKASEQVHSLAQRTVADEAAKWRAQREEANARDAREGFSYSSSPTSAFPSHSGPYLSSASAAAARSAALAAANAPSPGLANVAMNSPMPRPVSMASSGSHTAQPAALLPSFGRSSASSSAPSPLSTYPSSGGVSFPQPAHHSPTTTSSSGSSYPVTPASTAGLPTPGPMPLRPLYEYDGESTDSEGPGGWRTRQSKITTSPYPEPSRMAPHQLARDDVSTSSGMSRLGLSDAGSSHIDGLPYNSSHLAVTYPSLARHMSTHQKTQGYAPGAWGSTLPPAAPAIPTSPDTENGGSANAFAGVGATGWGASQAMEAARAAAARPTGPAASYSTSFSPPVPQPPSSSQPQSQSQSQSQPQPPLQPAPSVMSSSSSTYEPERRASERRPRLKTVVLPQATLPRFLSIASANTSRNLETCGLLLGREVVRSGDKARFVVETLLVPKQHATSDTCTMDEEEAVLAFTEARGLITLGWIHTHPSQSCFMSSVDLHTHASFQCMLPESFAVVCAPKSDPTFGIFRLTDPPGLKTVLNCTEKQAFHPHPDVPIYTDADKGHVQMRDSAPLEIVDLR